MTVSLPAFTADSEDDADKLLRAAYQAVADRFGPDEPLTQAVLYLINCAADAVSLLPDGDLQAARQALGCARAAVTTATDAVRRIHDEIRTGGND
jgi:hypothetical protein